MDKVIHSQLHLHSENFDLCRICLLEPETNRHIKFVHIFSRKNKEIKLQEHIKELFNIEIPTDDISPKILCETCLKTLLSLIEMKKLAAESQIVIKYIAKKKFGTTLDETSQSTSNESNILPNSIKKTLLSHNKSKTSINPSSVSNQGTSSQQLNVSESDYDDDDDDDDLSCQELNVNHDVICISDSEESIGNYKQDANPTNEVLNKSKHYCAICKIIKDSNHICSKNNSEFSTCLVPNCNILCRSIQDFEPHYRQHIGMPSGAIMCRICYKEIKNSERDMNGFHTHCHMDNIFKCYTCNVVFNNISEFADHKLKTHNGRLINAAGNYLCFHCEKSSPDLLNINEHITHCGENKIENVEENEIDELVPEKSSVANVNDKMKRKRKIVPGEKIPPPSNNVLFTCLKGNCNLIFQSFPVFKYHYREHFEIGNQYMCWQCCKPFFNINTLRIHQVKGNCRTPGMFKCYFCPEKFDDLQCLSIHKFTVHNGELICKNKKNVLCAFCKITTDVDNFKNHLVNCQLTNNKTIEPLTIEPLTIEPQTIKKPRYSAFKCERCTKVCITAAALSSHKKVHDPNKRKRGIQNLMNSSTIQSKNYCEMPNMADNIETNTVMNASSSRTARGNGTNKINYLDDLYFCTNCPKQFNTKKGLAKHCTVCPNMKKTPKKDPPKKYYCTQCKEYFTHLGFAEHWKVTHDVKLISKRRYSCNKCSFLFMYNIALLMHKEHVHDEIHNTLNITKTEANYCEPTIVTSLAKNDAEKPMETNVENCDVKTEYSENIDKLLDNEVQCEESVNKKLGNKIDDNVIVQYNSSNIENIDVSDSQSVNQNTFESNDCELFLKEHVNNKDEIILAEANKINDNSLITTGQSDEADHLVIVMDFSDTEDGQCDLIETVTVNGTQNMNGIVNDNKTVNPIIASKANQKINDLSVLDVNKN